ncbi:hypothetical protein TNCV_1244921 [Trichonephila clavipes]|nr:hypothetical protein TNCV_1244921 [Trichonephila clavipes]
MEIKLPSSGLIVLSLWRLIQLSTVKFAYSAFNTHSLKFSPRTLLALFTATTLANVSGFRLSYCFRKSFSNHLSYVIPSLRVHLDSNHIGKVGRKCLYLSEAPLVLNLATMSKFVLNKLVNKGMLFVQNRNPTFARFLAPFVL